jgi:hypothetical protein
MAARKRKGTKDEPWPEQVRERLRGSMLVNRLTDHVLGKCELQTTQVTAALGLLRKILPDLSAVDANVNATVKQRVVNAQPMAEDEWERRYGDSLEPAGRPAEGAD